MDRKSLNDRERRLNSVVLLADSSKINRASLYSFGALTDISILVTDQRADQSFTRLAADLGVEIVISNWEE